MAYLDKADILENTLLLDNDLLDILLRDHTTSKYIIWATDSYFEQYGVEFASEKQIKPQLITGKHGELIQPRIIRSLQEQRNRARNKGEVFTPLNIVSEMNKITNRSRINRSNWKTYVAELKLEITCGEAPFIVSRYDPVVRGEIIKTKDRVGFLDHKLQIVSKYGSNKKEWLKWARIAFQSSYGFEWQGDNILIARENLLYTLIDYYKEKYDNSPDLSIQKEFAEIISWNVFQMDGLKYVTPMSCLHEANAKTGQLALKDAEGKFKCEGCKYNLPTKHNGKYVKIMDWVENKSVKFVDLIS